MELFEVIERRYSFRGKFSNQPVPLSDLKKIVKAGTMAPSGKNAQTTDFIIVNDEKILNEIKFHFPSREFIQTCTAVIFAVVDKDPELIYHGDHFQIEDCSAAVQNMLLATTALGYATVWIDGFLRLENTGEKIGKYLDLPENKKLQIMLPIGVPEKEGPRRIKKSFEERVRLNSFRNSIS